MYQNISRVLVSETFQPKSKNGQTGIINGRKAVEGKNQVSKGWYALAISIGILVIAAGCLGAVGMRELSDLHWTIEAVLGGGALILYASFKINKIMNEELEAKKIYEEFQQIKITEEFQQIKIAYEEKNARLVKLYNDVNILLQDSDEEGDNVEDQEKNTGYSNQKKFNNIDYLTNPQDTVQILGESVENQVEILGDIILALNQIMDETNSSEQIDLD